MTDHTVTIPIEDLHIIRAALNSAYHHETVLDLSDSYRKLAPRPAESKLTTSLKNALSLLMSYIDLADPAVEPELEPEPELPEDEAEEGEESDG